jgi:meso-butanediol dehydrogenase/(S,S)-butanediol dehydrogenase/diacetyl reductase
MRLKERVAIVTGGGGGLGEGICLSLAKEGAHVVVSDLNSDMADKVARKVKERGHRSLAIRTDVRVAKECKALIDTTLKEMGQIDVLVCNAGEGGFGLRGNSEAPAILENISEEQWDLTLDVNLKGVFLCNQAVAPYFRKQKRGKIINISSIAGRKGADFVPHYSASKAGVIVFSQAVALQLAPFNINVNCICPGVIWTPMWETGAKVLAFTYQQFKGVTPDKIFEAMMDHMIPLKRPQTPEDIGNAVVFLASAEADQITGQALNVDGGAVFS